MLIGSARKFMKGGLLPAHVWSSVVLGFLLGMIPDYGASIGLVAVLLLCSALIRINTGLFALSLIVSKTILLVSLSWLFDLGQAALARGTQSIELFVWMRNGHLRRTGRCPRALRQASRR